jgi:hypothetical protein
MLNALPYVVNKAIISIEKYFSATVLMKIRANIAGIKVPSEIFT